MTLHSLLTKSKYIPKSNDVLGWIQQPLESSISRVTDSVLVTTIGATRGEKVIRETLGLQAHKDLEA